MASTRKFHKTTIVVSVLSEDEYRFSGLDRLRFDLEEGYCRGACTVAATEEMSGESMARELLKHDSDPDFFQLDKDGNDLNDDYYPTALA